MSHRTSSLTRFGVVRQYPFDLAAVSIGALFGYWVVTSFPDGHVLRLFVTFPLALFLPGYALVAVLFPASERRTQETATPPVETKPRGIDAVERLGLSFALSLTIVPVAGIVLSVTHWGFNTVSTAATLGVVTVVFAQLGVVRRLRTPQSARLTVSPLSSVARLRRDESAVATVSTIVLVLAVGLAVGALLVGFLAPASTGGYSELGLYNETDDGELVAGDVENEIEPGETVPVTVSIDNQEGEEVDYTVVVQEQVVEDGTVVERTQLEELETTIPDGTTGAGDLSVAPTAQEGETVRISVLLFEDDPPIEPENDDAIADTYFWVTVEG